MEKEKAIESEGDVIEALPDARFVVQLDNGHQIKASISGKLRLNRINIMQGDRVLVQLSIYDLTKGRIVRRKDNFNRNVR
jgi:translation initiation factor IF-1